MLLTVALALWGFGFGTWLVATVLGFHGVGAVGATVFIGVSAAVFGAGGLEYKVGYNETAGNDATQVRDVTEPVGLTDHLPFPLLTVLLGGVMFLRSLERAAQAGFEDGIPASSGDDDEPSERFGGFL